jgi:hypothetical protein
MNIEEALLILDTALEQNFLTDVQELVFHQSWSGQTYSEIAESSGYNAHYIKDVGYKLWKLLSQVFEEEVTKSNFRSVLRRQYVTFQHAMRASKGGASLTRNVSEEGESLSVYIEDSVSVPLGTSVSQGRSVSAAKPKALASGGEIDSPNNIASEKKIGESQQTPVVSTVLAAPLTTKNIDINSQKIKTDLLIGTPQFVKAKEATAKMHQDWGEAVDVLAFYGCIEKLNLLKQWIMNDRYRLVAMLGDDRD